MENGVKALLIAAAVLMAILLASVTVYVLGQPSNLLSSVDQENEAKRLKDFNRQFEAFYKKELYGVDIVSVTNKAIDNNRNNIETPEYFVTINISIKIADGYMKTNNGYTQDSLSTKIQAMQNLENKYTMQKLMVWKGKIYNGKINDPDAVASRYNNHRNN